MNNHSTHSKAGPELPNQSRPRSNPLVLGIVWLVAAVTLTIMLANGVRSTGRFESWRTLLHAVYVGALLWHLSFQGPAVAQLPEAPPILLKRWGFGRWIPALLLASVLGLLFLGGEGLLRPFIMVAAPVVLAAWWRGLKLRLFLVGLGLAAAAFLAGLPFLQNGFLNLPTYLFILGYVPLLFAAGGLLIQRTGLGASEFYAGRYMQAIKNVLWGSVLFIPLGLANAAGGSPGPWMDWVDQWWIPFTQPWFSGIQEEAYFRLFLVGLCYYLLRPAFPTRPAVAILGAVLFSAIGFGLGHTGSVVDRVMMPGLLYGLPMAVIFVRRDWEHAIGAHYMINMIPTLMLFLER